MGLSELFEGGSLMYINWQTHHAGAAWKEACSGEWAQGSTGGSWHGGRHSVGRSRAELWVGRAREVTR